MAIANLVPDAGNARSDGQVSRLSPGGESWLSMIGGAGNFIRDNRIIADWLNVGARGTYTNNGFGEVNYLVSTGVPLGTPITAATLTVTHRVDPLLSGDYTHDDDLNLIEVQNQDSPGLISNSDYQKRNNIKLASDVSFASQVAGNTMVFTLNAAGLALINAHHALDIPVALAIALPPMISGNEPVFTTGGFTRQSIDLVQGPTLAVTFTVAGTVDPTGVRKHKHFVAEQTDFDNASNQAQGFIEFDLGDGYIDEIGIITVRPQEPASTGPNGELNPWDYGFICVDMVPRGMPSQAILVGRSAFGQNKSVMGNIKKNDPEALTMPIVSSPTNNINGETWKIRVFQNVGAGPQLGSAYDDKAKVIIDIHYLQTHVFTP